MNDALMKKRDRLVDGLLSLAQAKLSKLARAERNSGARPLPPDLLERGGLAAIVELSRAAAVLIKSDPPASASRRADRSSGFELLSDEELGRELQAALRPEEGDPN